MTTPNPRGYPSSCSVLDRLRDSLREAKPHWSFDPAKHRASVRRNARAELERRINASLGI